MGYSTVNDVDIVLAQALTSARPDTTDRIPLTDIGGVRDYNRIPNTIVEDYIRFADSQIDGILTQMYYVPLRVCANGQWELEVDINEYNQNVIVTDAMNLVEGDVIRIIDDDTGTQERHQVATIVDEYTFTTVDAILTFFTATGEVRVVREQFPPPINQISARYAASFLYDKYFSAQNDPNVSEYGNKMRQVAMGQLNDILNGKTILKCQTRRGDLFGNPWADSAYAHRTPVDGYHTADRDMSQPS